MPTSTAARCLLPVLLAVHLIPSAAQAEVLFGFGYGGAITSASGTISASDNGDGSFTPFAMDGTWNGSAITGLLPPGSYSNDNILYYPGSPGLLSAAGIGFGVAGASVDVSFDGAVYHQLHSVNGAESLTDFLLTPIAL